MKNLNRIESRPLTACLFASVLGCASAANAADPDFTVTFPAGWACNAFDLQIEGWNGKQVIKEFKDKNGYVRTLIAGTGSELRYTNMTTPAKTYSTKSNGAVSHTTTYSVDGSSTVAVTGHNLIILFPTDFPSGPSTTLYVGRVVYTVDAAGTWVVRSSSGKATDICAAVS